MPYESTALTSRATEPYKLCQNIRTLTPPLYFQAVLAQPMDDMFLLQESGARIAGHAVVNEGGASAFHGWNVSQTFRECISIDTDLSKLVVK